ncbi:amino acid adenylation domain-containing protein [Streptomyces sp. NPDC096205]|uniref:non-ribosomal peptide synthetase n=1 Tax=Streptomyces sp. NPDC096205 TaxID=3366081 RepID=UPI00381FB2A0
MTAGVHGAISAAARAHPRRAAVVTDEVTLTYEELDDLSDRLCAHLVRAGTARQSVVGLHFARSAEQVVALLAALKAGCAYLPLDPRYPADRLRHMVTDSGAARLLTGPGLKPPQDWPVDCPVTEVALPLPPSPPAPPSDDTAVRTVHPHDLAYVLYTSGTTGRPKAVEVTHANVASLLRGLQASVLSGVGPARVAWNASVCFDASVQQWVRLCRGDTLVLLDEDVRADPAALVDDLVRHGVTDLDVVPSHLALLTGPLAAAGLPLRLLVGGEPVAPALWAELRRLGHTQGLRAWNMYGPTECTVDATTAPVDGETPHLGAPLPDVRCHVLDTALRPVPAGETGELFLAGPGVGRGYRGQPGRTAAVFLPDPFAGDGGRMYRTGDLVRYDDQGRLEFVRRRDRQVKVRGHRVELGEVEAALTSLPEVAGGAVVLRDDLPAGPGLVAYAVPAAGGSPSVDGPVLRERLGALLPGHAVPAVVVLLDALPVGPHGKVDHTALPRPAFTAAAPEESASPLEREVALIWTKVLGVQRIGAADNFFDLGGDSLAVGKVLNRCRERFGVRLRARALFENPTLRGFAAAVRHETERLSPSPLPSNEGIPPRD